MAAAMSRSLVTGIMAALLCFAFGLVAESLLIPRLRHTVEKPAADASAQPQQPATADGFTVTTSEMIVSQDSWKDPFLLPASLVVLVVMSGLTYRRLRRPQQR